MAARAGADNPKEGDLVVWKRATTGDEHWIVKDFLPWGCDGRHAWVIQNPRTGDKRVAFKADIERVKE